MDDIATLQNQPAQIQRLAAQRRLYRLAKRWASLQALLASGTPILAAVLVARDPKLEIWGAFAGLVASLLDVGFLDPRQERLRERAATIQEDFDCRVLNLPWHDVIAGPKPDTEDIHDAGVGRERAKPSLENWYPPIVSTLPIKYGRLICQRTNCWWDAKLRRRYAVGVSIALILVSIFVAILALYRGLTVERFVLAILAPLSPLLLWSMREIKRQRECAQAVDELKSYGQSVWLNMNDTTDESEATKSSRAFQDGILSRRRQSPFVFDWVYRLSRNKYGEQMIIGAEAMVNEIKSRTSA